MPVKIRLARHGRKARPFYHIVIADSRAPRDGRFIERIGSYNPNTNPATIDLKFDRALDWLMKGAQPTDTARSILSHEGVMYKKHLMGGVKKGAFDEATMESKFETWKQEKALKVQDKRNALASEAEKQKEARLAAEKELNAAREAEIQKKIDEENQAKAEAEAAAKAEAEAAEAAEETTEETAEEAEASEEPKAE